MSWDEMRSSVRRAAQSEKQPSSTPGIIGSMLRLSAVAGVLLAAILIPATTFVAVTASQVSKDVVELPLELQDQPTAQTTRMLASDGSLLAYFYDENRQDVPLDDIAPVMKDAMLSIEDARFYEHGALDVRGTLRALINNASDGQTQGGSSITQQLVKQTLVSQATTAEQRQAATAQSTSRKIRELKLAIEYEEKYSKDEILERYLNLAYFGDGAYGVSAAAYHFFSTSPDKLNAAQSAMLAGLVRSPTEYDPNVYPERTLQRRNTVLAVMEREEKITPEESTELQASELGLKVTEFPNGCVASVASFSCDYARQYLLLDEDLGETVEERQLLLERGGLTIKSNIDVRMQEAAQEAVDDTVDPEDTAIGALAMVEPGTGKVRGVAQSRPMGRDKDAGESFINFTVPRAVGQSGGFPAGSTFKMFTAAAALESGIEPRQTYNAPQRIVVPRGTYQDCEGGITDEWRVSNSTTSGRMDMTRALRQSVNTYFAQLEEDAGLCNTVRAAESMGITVPFDPENNITNQVPSFTLGVTDVSPLDMAAAYATPASGGEYCEPQPIAEIVDRAGAVVKQYEPQCERVMSRRSAAQLNEMLRGLQEPGGFGFSNGTGLEIPSAAKTGTTQDNKAVWYTGYTPELSTAAMVAGVTDQGIPRSLEGVTINDSFLNFDSVGGSSVAGPMWAEAMQTIQEYLSPADFDAPPRPAFRQPANNNNNDDDDD